MLPEQPMRERVRVLDRFEDRTGELIQRRRRD